MSTPRMYRIEPDALNELIQSLRKLNYTVIGPTPHGGAIILDEIISASQLPIGKTDEQAPAQYHLKDGTAGAFFGYSAGPQSWKKYLFPPILKLFSAHKDDEGSFVSEELPEPQEQYALLGVRACDLSAIQIQDKVFGGGAYQDPAYLKIRNKAFIIAVNCTHAGGTCFCSSVRTGPHARVGFDLALSEVAESEHYLIIEVGTKRGEEMIRYCRATARRRCRDGKS